MNRKKTQYLTALDWARIAVGMSIVTLLALAASALLAGAGWPLFAVMTAPTAVIAVSSVRLLQKLSRVNK